MASAMLLNRNQSTRKRNNPIKQSLKAINLNAGDLEAVLAVADAGSFRLAAKALGISQPSVSARVRHAEDLLGVKLFHRTTRKVMITESGERLRIRAERALAELRSIVQEFNDEAQLRRGRVDVAATPTLMATIIPPISRAFMKRRPGIQVVLHDDIYGRTLGRLTSGEVDVAIVPYNAADPPDSALRFIKLFDEEFFVLVPEGHALSRHKLISIQELAAYPMASMPALSSHWATLSHAFQEHDLPFKPDFLSYNLLSMIGLVRAELCTVLLPSIIFPILNMSDLKTIPVEGGLTREIGIVTAKGRALSPAAEALIRYIRSELGASRNVRIPQPAT